MPSGGTLGVGARRQDSGGSVPGGGTRATGAGNVAGVPEVYLLVVTD